MSCHSYDSNVHYSEIMAHSSKITFPNQLIWISQSSSSSFSSKRMELQRFFLLLLFVGLASADLLQNSDFESPPSNLPANYTTPFVLLAENNTIPGWTFEGTVQYVTAGQTITLQDNGHAIQLGQDGKINQTFIASSDDMYYILTLTLAPGGRNCTANADVVVSAPDSHTVFTLKQHYENETWESYGQYLGRWDRDEPINLVLESQTTESDANSTCWPVIDKLLLKTVGTLVQGNDNLLLNGGFEVGPEFLSNSTLGILLDEAPSPVQSALRQWSIIGTVKYIDSKHFSVPKGNAAIEIVSGVSAGIETATSLTEGSTYKLEFMLGDGKDACEGKFIVGVQAGSVVQNFTLQSLGTGSATKESMTFKAGVGSTTISFLSYSTNQAKDGVFCGPVIDEVVLSASHGLKLQPKLKILIYVVVLVTIL
ncbi:hypothetical protein Ddye_000048 [Dipteronia dyeriana]|uniref:DUF642 domain-containing protein n=1 Tax=Dipteronia dyeriana TaxID=168575 RepID=A0AAD9XL12_9ROSI|nr:hypothetical protein Ddye_000048 [Dipteronia dyeriana]